MHDLRELYQQIILDHNRNPRNFKELPDATHTAEGYNPLCGDRIKLYVRVEGDTIQDVGFTGAGCAISRAAASLMTSAVKGKTTGEAEKLFEDFHAMVTGVAEPDAGSLGKLAAFQGVREFPARVKCANLSWHALDAALRKKQAKISTE